VTTCRAVNLLSTINLSKTNFHSTNTSIANIAMLYTYDGPNTSSFCVTKVIHLQERIDPFERMVYEYRLTNPKTKLYVSIYLTIFEDESSFHLLIPVSPTPLSH